MRMFLTDYNLQYIVENYHDFLKKSFNTKLHFISRVPITRENPQKLEEKQDKSYLQSYSIHSAKNNSITYNINYLGEEGDPQV